MSTSSLAQRYSSADNRLHQATCNSVIDAKANFFENSYLETVTLISGVRDGSERDSVEGYSSLRESARTQDREPAAAAARK